MVSMLLRILMMVVLACVLSNLFSIVRFGNEIWKIGEIVSMTAGVGFVLLWACHFLD